MNERSPDLFNSNLQGIATPVEAFKRGGRGALSYYGPEQKTKKQEVL
jgi:hypothetical protein